MKKRKENYIKILERIIRLEEKVKNLEDFKRNFIYALAVAVIAGILIIVISKFLGV